MNVNEGIEEQSRGGTGKRRRGTGKRRRKNMLEKSLKRQCWKKA